MNDDLGPCDNCGGPIGERGRMKPTGRFGHLAIDGLEYEVYDFYCSEECAANE